MNGMVIKQLEKALECKDDKELRLRVEVLLDILKEQSPIIPQTPQSLSPNITQKKNKQVQGPGAIMSSNGEQLVYTRPAGT